jgi:thiol:disulfide interchange protein DsbD
VTPGLPAQEDLKVSVTYQGCAEMGLCYPPQTRHFTVNWPGNPDQSTTPSTPSKASTETAGGLADYLASSSSLLIIGTFFLLGLGLTFTPCVLPMLPILAGAIAGQGQDLSVRKGLTLSLAYVLGMATTYTAAGVLVGYFGASMNLQAAMQNPLALSIFAGVFVILSLSMFGFYELQLPAFLRDRLNRLGQQPGQASEASGPGRYLGLALLGLISALVVSPCVSAPLAGALIYISTTGDAFLGGTALFALSLGMGVPLLLVGAGGGRLLPRAGNWMLAVKSFFGVLLLALAISLLDRFLPGQLTLILWGLLGVIYASHLGSGKELQTGWQKTQRGLAIALGVYALALLLGGLAGQEDPLQPLAGGLISTKASSSVAEKNLFTRLDSPDALHSQLAAAASQDLPVVLDFYADWCASCQVMEKEVFRHLNPEDYAGQILFLQADVTRNTAEHSALMQEYGIFGPPALLYFQASGEEITSLRDVGELGLEEFRKRLQTLRNL